MFKVGDIVKFAGYDAVVRELPSPGRRMYRDHYLIEYNNGLGHDGCGETIIKSRRLGWILPTDYVVLVRRGTPLTPFEEDLSAYIAEQKRELGL